MSENSAHKQKRLGRWVLLAIVIFGLSAIGWMSWNVYIDSSEDNLVVLRADPTPFRIKPEEGTIPDVPNQDSTFMNLIDGSPTNGDDTAEVISLSEPVPEPPPIPLQPAEHEPDATSNADMDSAEPQSPTMTSESPDLDKIVLSDDNSPTPVKAEDAESDGGQDAPPSADEQQSNSVAQPSLPTLPKPRPKGAKNRQGWMMIQLAAFREEDKARTAAALLNEKHKVRLKGYSLGVTSITSTDGQLFWRVITDPLPKQDALSLCGDLKRAGQDCILRQQTVQQP